MSVDIVLSLDLASFGVAAVILGFGAYRALLFRRAFNDPIFRSRALWTAVVLAAWIVPNDSQILFTDLPPPSNGLGVFFDVVTLVLAIVLIIVSVIFLDRNIKAAMELDFFHRDDLGWRKFRLISIVGAPVSLVANLLTNVVLGNSDLANLTLLLLTCTLAYGVAALLVGGLRVYNRYMRRYLQFVGLGFALLLVTIPLAVPLLYDVFLLSGSYLLYLSATSLYHLREIQESQTNSSQTPPKLETVQHQQGR
jgi:hypothetical protein